MTENLCGYKVGDHVRTNYFGVERIATIVKVTPTRARLRLVNGQGDTRYQWRHTRELDPPIPNSLLNCVDPIEKEVPHGERKQLGR